MAGEFRNRRSFEMVMDSNIRHIGGNKPYISYPVKASLTCEIIETRCRYQHMKLGFRVPSDKIELKLLSCGRKRTFLLKRIRLVA